MTEKKGEKREAVRTGQFKGDSVIVRARRNRIIVHWAAALSISVF